MSQGAYPPGGYEPGDGSPRPEDMPPPTRATARVPQPPAWAPPQPGAPQPPQPPGPSGPPPGVYGGGFGSAAVPSSAPPASGPPHPGPPSYEQPAPPASGRASASASVPGGTYNPGGDGGFAPPNYAGPEPSRFANLRYDDPAIEGPKKSRRGLIIGIVIAGVLVFALAGTGVFLLLDKTSKSASFAVNSCVKKSDTHAIATSCSDAGAYQIVSKVDDIEKCPVKGQPYVVLQESGKADQILCLKPAH